MPDSRDELSRALSKLEVAADALVEQNVEAGRHYLWAQQNRIGLLWVHGVAGIGIGALMLTFGTAYNIEATVGLWTRSALAGAGMIGGALLIYGLTRVPRSIGYEAAGLIVLAIWDAAIAASFTAVVVENPPRPAWPWEAIPLEASRPYPVAVYLALLALLALHAWTLHGLLKLTLANEKAAR